MAGWKRARSALPMHPYFAEVGMMFELYEVVADFVHEPQLCVKHRLKRLRVLFENREPIDNPNIAARCVRIGLLLVLAGVRRNMSQIELFDLVCFLGARQ